MSTVIDPMTTPNSARIGSACCTWGDFKSALLAAASGSGLTIDWHVARNDWKTYSMTGYEAMITQQRAGATKERG